MPSLLRIPKSILWNSAFLARNFYHARKLPVFQPVRILDRYEIVPCGRGLIEEVARLSAILTHAGRINFTKKILLRYYGEKLCFVLIDTAEKKAIGYTLYYFNRKDIIARTIHVGYSGIAANYRNHGIGSSFRITILKHFAQTPDLDGVSTRISLSNVPSLRINLKNGYEIKEQYFDKQMNEERVYMVCDLNIYRAAEKTKEHPPK